MEVVSAPIVNQKTLGVLSRTGLIRKANKPNPYIPVLPSPEGLCRSKTKSPEGSDISAVNDSIGFVQIQQCRTQDHFEVPLQQPEQQLFLHWQREPQQQQQSDDSAQVEIQNISQDGQQKMPVMVRRLSNLKVQELKNECKKRQLPVSGPKPQLVERLRQFEKEILGCTPDPSPEPLKEDELAATSSDTSSDSSMNTSPKNHIFNLQPDSSRTATVSEFPTNAVCVTSQYVPVQPAAQLVQLVDERGNVLGMATVQLPPDLGPKRVVVQQPRPVAVANTTAAVAINNSVPSFQSGTFCFAQMGSGGQFTLVQSETVEPVKTSTVTTESEVPVTSTSTSNVVATSSTVVYSATNSQSCSSSTCFKTTPQPETRQVQPQNHQSPRSADQAGSSPSMPNGGGSSGTSVIAESLNEATKECDEMPSLDPNDPASVLTPETLQMHEEMLRKQHKLIESLEKEVTSAQNMLKNQQQIILAAKKAQQKLREQQRQEGEVARGDKQWLRDVDIRHVNKQHIQQFLQHKGHATNLQYMTQEHQRLKSTEARLQEELHVDQAVHDIVRLIKQDPRTALLIVQLLRKYQLERTQMEAAANSSAQNKEHQEQQMIYTQQASAEVNQENNDMIISGDSQQSDQDDQNVYTQQEMSGHVTVHHHDQIHFDVEQQSAQMDDTYGNVVNESGKVMGSTPTQTIDCTVTAAMESPKAVQENAWNLVQQFDISQNLSVPQESGSSQCSITDVLDLSQLNNQFSDIPVFASCAGSTLDDIWEVVQRDRALTNRSDQPFLNGQFTNNLESEAMNAFSDSWVSQEESFNQYQMPSEDGRSTDPMYLAGNTDTNDGMEVDNNQMEMNYWLTNIPVNQESSFDQQ